MATGTTPAGTNSEAQAAGWVQQMFADIAPRYDLLNHLLSFNIDRGWRRALLACLEPITERPNAKVLDLCCGTGDVLLDLKETAKATLFGSDFCHPMLVAAQKKGHARGYAAQLFESDALALPLADGTLDGIAIAFGFRNLANYERALLELARVLAPGGILAILEFSHPPGTLMRAAYGFYSRTVLPAVGGLLSGSREAYSYLPESIERFPAADKLRSMMSGAGFTETKFRLLSRGIAALHSGQKPKS